MKCDRRAQGASRLLAALGFGVVGLSSAVAYAVPPEFLRNIALHPSDEKVFAVRYESAFGGLLFSRDGGQSLQMVPGRTFYRYSLQRRVPMLFDSQGKLVIALDEGLLVDDGAGCVAAPAGSDASASEPAVKGLWVADLAPHPSDPDTTFLVTTGNTNGKHAGVWRRDKQGVLTPLGMSEPAPAMPNQIPFIASSLEVVARAASTDGVRLIVAGTRYDYSTTPQMSAPVLRVSDDLGMTWTTRPIPDVDKTNGAPLILAIDGSTDAFKAIVALEVGFGDNSADPMDPLFVTKDGGQSFTPYLDKIQVAGEAVRLPSGQILLGDRGVDGGLWSAANFDSAPSKVADFAVHCLAYQASSQKLFLCKGYEVGLYDVAANSFCAMTQLKEVSGFVSCPSAPLEQNMQGIDQLCNGFCGAAHFASAPVCSTFQVQAGRICGPAAYAYDNENPDPEKRWIEPPGSVAASRCAGFTGLPAGDAGVAPDADAGARDAGTSATSEAGAPVEPQLDAGGQQPAQDADAAHATKTDPGGCHLEIPGARRVRGAESLFALFALLSTLALRRTRR